MVSTKLSHIFSILRQYGRMQGCEQSPERMIREFKGAADDASRERLFESLRLFDDSLRCLEQKDSEPASGCNERN